MQKTLSAVCMLLMAVGLAIAQTPAQPPGKNQDNINAINKKIEENQEQIRKATAARDQAEKSLQDYDKSPPDPIPYNPDDAAAVFDHLMSNFGSPTHGGIRAAYDDDIVVPASHKSFILGQLSDAKWMLAELHKKRDQLFTELVAAGGTPQGYSMMKFTPSPAHEEQEFVVRANEFIEWINKYPPPPPAFTAYYPPPISSSAGTPTWDVGASFGAGSSFPPLYHLLPFMESSAITPYLNAMVDLVSQGQDATGRSEPGFRYPGKDIIVNPAPVFSKEPREFDTGRAIGNVFAMLRRPRVASLAPAAQPSSPMALRPSVKVFFVSLGRSTGEAVRMTVVNDGNVPVRIATDGFALVPLANVSVRDVERELAKLAGSPQVTVNLDAYCRDFRKPPPAAGTVMGLAEPAVQAQIGPVQRMFAASRRLMDEGALKPDVDDPEMYFHSIRQWSRWTLEEKFTERTFTAAFIEHTRKNVAAAGQRWQSGYDKEVRTLAASRWRDVQLVLAATNVR